MRRVWLSLVIGVVLTLVYWAICVAIAYSLFAGDRRDGAPAAGEPLLFWLAAAVLWLLALGAAVWRGRGAWRVLTAGELAAARGVFGDAIAWERVRIYARGFTPFQPRHVAVSPLGAVHFRREDFLPDFSTRWNDMAWLIHELVHVWQHQTGVPVILRGLWERRYQYGALDPAKPLVRYGIEQQGAIVEDWFRITQGQPAWRGSGSEADYRAVIPFIPEPCHASHVESA
jgi:hypothetical protein